MTDHDLAALAAGLGLPERTITLPLSLTLDERVQVTLEQQAAGGLMLTARLPIPSYDREILPRALAAASYENGSNLRFTPAIVSDQLCLLTALSEQSSAPQVLNTMLTLHHTLLSIVEGR